MRCAGGTECYNTCRCPKRETGERLFTAENVIDIVRTTFDILVMSQIKNESFSLGDGNSSHRIVEDLVTRLKRNFDRNNPPHLDAFKAKHFEGFHQWAF